MTRCIVLTTTLVVTLMINWLSFLTLSGFFFFLRLMTLLICISWVIALNLRHCSHLRGGNVCVGSIIHYEWALVNAEDILAKFYNIKSYKIGVSTWESKQNPTSAGSHPKMDESDSLDEICHNSFHFLVVLLKLGGLLFSFLWILSANSWHVFARSSWKW